MEHRYVIFERWLGPRIFKIPLNQVARLRFEYSDRKPQIFESLSAAKEAALTILEYETPRSYRVFRGGSAREQVERRRRITELTEDKVEPFNG